MDLASFNAVLDFGNLIFSSANVIICFSLFVYVVTHNYRSGLAQGFYALMAFVSVAHVVDVGMSEVASAEAADFWLRMQWLGIAFVPAAYFHFSDALLRSTGDASRWRRRGTLVAYVVGGLFFIAAVGSDLLVDGVTQTDSVFHLVPGRLFGLFTAYYSLVSLSGWFNISRARQQCLTSTSRRRMSYLTLAFIAPSLSVFPFLLVPATGRLFSITFISLLTLIGNLGTALMTIVIGYIVAYQGVLVPDRVVKHRLVHYLLRGPLVAIIVIFVMLAIPRVDHIVGLPRETVLIISVAGVIVVMQVLINMGKPGLDRLLYRRDREEVNWIQTLEERLLTTTDLQQLLENTVIAMCDLLRSESGFIITMENSQLSVSVFCGSKELAQQLLDRVAPATLLERLRDSRRDEFIAREDFVLADGHWLLPLRGRSDPATLGILGVRKNVQVGEFEPEELEAMYGLVRRAETALEDMRLQQQVFALLRGMDSELDEIQQWRSHPPYVGEHTLQRMEMNPVHSPGFTQAVKDALSQYWGGPKLTHSPLLKLRVVRQRLAEHDNVAARAMRSVLEEAIIRLRPTGEQDYTDAAWLIYNILDLRFLQSERIRDIVDRLAMSESDYYRKQRVAIEQVAETLAKMELSENSQG